MPAGVRSESGLAAVEFALIAPLFLALVFGIIGYGIYFGAWIAVRHASAEGARAAVAGLSTTERQTLARNMVKTIFTGYAPVFQWTEDMVTADAGGCTNCFRVQVTYKLPGLKMLSELLPALPTEISVTSTVPNGSY
jgi:Flp pilus assembly protein TadG